MTRRRPPLPERPVHISRRGFLGGAGTGAVALAVTGCTTDELDGVTGPASSSTSTSVERARRFFNPTEAQLVDDLTARILPGSAEDPGAREAEVVVYIDALLESGGWGNEPIYRAGPFISREQIAEERAEAEQDGEEGEEGADGGSGGGGGGGDEGGGSPDLGTTAFGVTRRPVDAYDRYGEQAMMTPPEVYRAALPAVDAHARDRFGAPFGELDDPRRDAVLRDIEDDDAPAFTDVNPQDFFVLLRQHTIEGMFSDPMYGGNRDLVGWSLIGWPGAQRAYSPEEMQTETEPRPPQAMEHLPHFNPGRRGTGQPRGRGPVLPQAGSPHDDRHGR